MPCRESKNFFFDIPFKGTKYWIYFNVFFLVLKMEKSTISKCEVVPFFWNHLSQNCTLRSYVSGLVRNIYPYVMRIIYIILLPRVGSPHSNQMTEEVRSSVDVTSGSVFRRQVKSNSPHSCRWDLKRIRHSNLTESSGRSYPTWGYCVLF